MQYLTLLLAAVSLVSATPVAVPEPIAERSLLYCGSQPYQSDAYTCYAGNNNLLCPILHGVIYQPCWNACFNPAEYGCDNRYNGQLFPVGKCGEQVYDKNTYVCIGTQLCPKAAGNLCGRACYESGAYYCSNGVLYPQPGH
ncbi:hypothetical protein BJ508DRAFT_319124 [Ascobolus immersus RN42]|uniref:Endo-1,3(4)-beta-glucanase 1 carbohydrate binding domain-containing protein n=1 Tax=Ascobolus immersus RN42 TaxID=1160509 RepID=A0A3N4I684_ASCIM|nr:hypothetical protein BJ508DRAFT_319124 [Ascobolus immersus RN42]